MKTFLVAAAAAVALVATNAAAQKYPDHPVTVIVPFAAGGPTDIVARIVGDHMSKTLGQQLIIVLDACGFFKGIDEDVGGLSLAAG